MEKRFKVLCPHMYDILLATYYLTIAFNVKVLQWTLKCQGAFCQTRIPENKWKCNAYDRLEDVWEVSQYFLPCPSCTGARYWENSKWLKDILFAHVHQSEKSLSDWFVLITKVLLVSLWSQI